MTSKSNVRKLINTLLTLHSGWFFLSKLQRLIQIQLSLQKGVHVTSVQLDKFSQTEYTHIYLVPR